MDTAKFEATAARFKAHMLELRAKRHKVKLCTDPPKPQESAHSEKKPRAALPPMHRCKAKTLEGKQCGFKSTHGDFCKKHSIKT